MTDDAATQVLREALTDMATMFAEADAKLNAAVGEASGCIAAAELAMGVMVEVMTTAAAYPEEATAAAARGAILRLMAEIAQTGSGKA